MSDSLQPHGLQYVRPPCPSRLPELAQTHVHKVTYAIQPSHPLSSPSLAFNLSQHQGLFQWVSSSHQVAKVLWVSASALVFPMNIQDWFLLGLIGLISLQSKGLARVFSNTTVQKHQFFSAQPSLWSNSHIHPSMTRKKQRLVLVIWNLQAVHWSLRISLRALFPKLRT